MGMEELKQICTDFREGMLQGESSKDKCFMIIQPLSAYLSFIGYKNEPVVVEIKHENKIIEHWIIEFPDGSIIDPTIDQFNFLDTYNEKVYAGSMPSQFNPKVR